MPLANKLEILRAAFVDLSPQQREVATDFLIGFVSGHVEQDQWVKFVEASRDAALQTSPGRKRETSERYDKGTVKDA